MTDSSSLIITNPLTNSQSVAAAPVQPPPLYNGSLSDPNIQEEEEYTIKCICAYADDDGNTVYCEKCDTWQHIECYYPSKKVPEEHFCADCSPRDLDAKRATERQRRHREAIDGGGDRKVKRPTTKTQKKKHKDSTATIEQINGWHLPERHDSLTNGRDQPPPAKKPKTSHRTSGSIVSLNGESRKRAISNLQSYPSPSKSPQDLFRYPPIPAYTPEFLELYDRDEGTTNARGNEHTIQALGQLSAWRGDPSLLVSGTAQPSAKSPFVRAEQSLDDVKLPEVTVETTEKKDVEVDGKHPTWRTIRTKSPIRKDELIGEIIGEVGVLEEYCLQKSTPNRWHELRHPDPFVFFHPHMSIYVDSRRKGTQFRYLRRSCRPNVTLKTFVSDDGEWRHFFVAKDDIEVDKELTAAWFLDPAMFQNQDLNKEDQEQQAIRQTDWVSRILANFGDCACEDGEPCLFSRFDRRSPPKPSDNISKEKGARKKRTKSKHAVSPMSTGQATNSRAGSETLKQDDEERFDRRSTSGSSHSPARSRDVTPLNVAALDADPVLGNGLTARELKKIQAAERMFEQGQSQQKKKKRTSGGSTLSTPNVNAAKQLAAQNSPYSLIPHISMGPDHYSGSPPPKSVTARSKEMKLTTVTPASPPASKRVYKDMAVQTLEEEIEPIICPVRRRKFMTPTQRLLRKVLADKERYEQECAANSAAGLRNTSPAAPQTIASEHSVRDVEMKDAPVISITEERKLDVKPPPLATMKPFDQENQVVYPLPSQAAHSRRQFKIPSAPPRLQLSTLPPVPAFPTGSSSGTPPATGTTPSGITPTTVQSPLQLITSTSYPGLSTGAITPSPAKKKLSLGDYMSRRNLASTPSSEKSQAQTFAGSEPTNSREVDVANFTNDMDTSLRPSDAVKQEAAAQGGLNGSAIEDAPSKDDVAVNGNVNNVTTHPRPFESVKLEPGVPTSTAISPQVTEVLAQLAKINAQTQAANSSSN